MANEDDRNNTKRSEVRGDHRNEPWGMVWEIEKKKQ
jgi:hypothetical protein